MGYHIYSLAEFNLNKVGKHKSYLYFFSQSDEYLKNFAEQIGSEAVSITQGMDGVDGLFLLNSPNWLNVHAIYYHHILVFCPTKLHANKVLSRIKKLISPTGEKKLHEAWFKKSYEEIRFPGRVDGTAVFVIPRGEKAGHLLSQLCRLIRTGALREQVKTGKIKKLARAIEVNCKVKVRSFENTIVLDWKQNAVRSISKQELDLKFKGLERLSLSVKESLSNSNTNSLPTEKELIETASNIFADTDGAELTQIKIRLGNLALEELNQYRKNLAHEVPSDERDIALKKIGEMRRHLRQVAKEKQSMTFQASIGFMMFGNGAKLVFDKKLGKRRNLEAFNSYIQKLFVSDAIKNLPDRSDESI